MPKVVEVIPSYWLYIPSRSASPRHSLRQSTTVEDFAMANSVFIVITSAKILLMWLLCSKIYIQFTIFNTYFLTKLLFTNKRYHLHVLEKCLYVLQEVRSMIYFRQFIHPLSLHWHGNGTSFASRSYIIISTKFCKVTVLPVPKKNKNCDIKQKLFI